ncbi:hypothetical protein RF11_05222 [Thelohanellus kitauei]|nr:hypothetical protein RF11_05222 [Thelohanellus kitauei]
MNFLRIAQDRQKVLFIDETGFKVNDMSVWSRAHKNRFGFKMVNFEIDERAYSAESFLEYLFEIFEIFRAREISDAYLLMDNANSKSSDEVFSSFETSSTHITSNDCLGFYGYIESYLPDCIQGCPVEN